MFLSFLRYLKRNELILQMIRLKTFFWKRKTILPANIIPCKLKSTIPTILAFFFFFNSSFLFIDKSHHVPMIINILKHFHSTQLTSISTNEIFCPHSHASNIDSKHFSFFELRHSFLPSLRGSLKTYLVQFIISCVMARDDTVLKLLQNSLCSYSSLSEEMFCKA